MKENSIYFEFYNVKLMEHFKEEDKYMIRSDINSIIKIFFEFCQ